MGDRINTPEPIWSGERGDGEDLCRVPGKSRINAPGEDRQEQNAGVNVKKTKKSSGRVDFLLLD